MTREHHQIMARLLRETADLIERGLIPDWRVDITSGYAQEPDPATGGFTMRHVATGQRTVIITLQGSGFERSDWESAAGEHQVIGSRAFKLIPP